MNIETYENLLRVEYKRIYQARLKGNWKEVSEATTRIEKLKNEYKNTTNR
jgi:hypothetical protein